MPVVTMIAGPNGSGKSTLKAYLEARGADFGEWLNADELARSLTGSAEARSLQAQERVRAARIAAMQSGRDYCFETVMSHASHIDHLREARRAGYIVQFIYVCTDDPRINIQNVSNRVAEGGHDVPQERIVSLHARSLANLPLAVEVSNRGWLFDNSDWANGQGYRLVATSVDGKLTPTASGTANPPNWLMILSARR